MKSISSSPSSPGHTASTNGGEPGQDSVIAIQSVESASPPMEGQDLDVLIGQAFERAVESMDDPWQRGDLTSEKVASAIELHRSNHPYRHD